jgi:hypothetical protein
VISVPLLQPVFEPSSADVEQLQVSYVTPEGYDQVGNLKEQLIYQKNKREHVLSNDEMIVLQNNRVFSI